MLYDAACVPFIHCLNEYASPIGERYCEYSFSLHRLSLFSGDNSSIHASKYEAESKGFRDRVIHGAMIISKVSKQIKPPE